MFQKNVENNYNPSHRNKYLIEITATATIKVSPLSGNRELFGASIQVTGGPATFMTHNAYYDLIRSFSLFAAREKRPSANEQMICD